MPLDAVGHFDGDVFDPHCGWLRRREIGDGAVLVRPDRCVAWRSMGAAAAPADELAAALGAVLGRPLREVGRITQPA